MSNQLTGTIKVINDTVQVSEKFKKREFVVTDNNNEMYPQDILFQAVQDKCDVLDAYNVGDSITVSFNLRGREWTNPQGEVKYFNTLDAWRVEKTDGDVTKAELKQAEATEETDDLPF
jgi:hypothetical protein